MAAPSIVADVLGRVGVGVVAHGTAGGGGGVGVIDAAAGLGDLCGEDVGVPALADLDGDALPDGGDTAQGDPVPPPGRQHAQLAGGGGLDLGEAAEAGQGAGAGGAQERR